MHEITHSLKEKQEKKGNPKTAQLQVKLSKRKKANGKFGGTVTVTSLNTHKDRKDFM